MTTIEGKYQAIDFETALDKVGGDLPLLAELAELFRAERPKLLSALQRAVADRNGPAARAAAHSLKGSLAIFSAKQATSLAARLEESAKAGELAAAAEILAVLEEEVEKVCGELQRIPREAPQDGASHRAIDGREIS
jgi:HPt (histidine-containing phosphotransfer) domain-containing protein